MSRLDDIKWRLAMATPGPWARDARWGYGNNIIRPRSSEPDIGEEVRGAVGDDGVYREVIVETDSGYYPPADADAEFIAHARQDIPYLLGELRQLQEARRAGLREVEELRGEVVRLKRQLDDYMVMEELLRKIREGKW